MAEQVHTQILTNIIRSIELPAPIWKIEAIQDSCTICVRSPIARLKGNPTLEVPGYSFLNEVVRNRVEFSWDSHEKKIYIREAETFSRVMKDISERLYSIAKNSISNRKARREFTDKVGYNGTDRLAIKAPEQLLAVFKAYHAKQIDQYMVHTLYERLYDTKRR